MHRAATLSILAALGLSAHAAGAADEPPKDAPASTPKIQVKNIGLHIGGGPNDKKTKRPYQEALEARFDAFIACHEKSESTEGTFGVDLTVQKEGGHPEVSEPRTAMKGEAFRACMVEAFRSAELPGSNRGAVRFSYSLRFSVAD